MHKKLIVSLLAMVATTWGARAGVAPVVIHLTETNPSYVVPATNVLVIENGYVGENSSIAQFLIVSNGPTVIGMRIDNWFRKITPLQPSLKIPGGFTVTANSLSVSNDQKVVLFGLLVGPDDLYASIPARFDTLARAGGQLDAQAELDRPLPVRIKVQESPDLASWSRSTNALVGRPAGDAVQITVPADHPIAEFYRLDARLQRGPAGI